MRLLCNGVALDLEAGATMSFKKLNPLFAFDKLTCERTQSFNLPATPTNDRVLELAKIPAYYGAGMRRRFDAELQDGTVVKQGYLYVDKYASGKYSAVFVTGELFGLLKIKNAGKISDIWHPTETEGVGYPDYDADFTSRGAEDFRRWRNIAYRRGIGYTVPSMAVDFMVSSIAAQLGVSVSIPSDAKNYRILPPVSKGIKEQKITISNTNNGVAPVTDNDPEDPFNTMESTIDVLEPQTFAIYTIGKKENDQFYSKDWNYLLGTLHALQNVTLEFPASFPDNVFLGKVEVGGTISFLGDYSFDKSRYSVQGEAYNNNNGECVTLDEGNTSGEPLAGKKVDIAAGTFFIFLTRKDYCHSPWGDDYYYKNDWAFDQPDYSYELTIKGTQDVVTDRGELVRLADNLPDFTFIDLLKMIGYVSGKQINYTDAEGIIYDDLDINAWPMRDITRVSIETKEVTRTFSDFGQLNVVRFEEDDLLYGDENTTLSYAIQNENIAEENELAKIPLSPAGYIYEDNVERAYVRNGVPETGEEFEPQKFMLLRSNGAGGDKYMHRVELTKNAALQSLCDASTSVTVSARMTLQEYEALAAKVTILYAGTRYVWTEAQYSKGVVTLKLSKIPA